MRNSFLVLILLAACDDNAASTRSAPVDASTRSMATDASTRSMAADSQGANDAGEAEASDGRVASDAAIASFDQLRKRTFLFTPNREASHPELEIEQLTELVNGTYRLPEDAFQPLEAGVSEHQLYFTGDEQVEVTSTGRFAQAEQEAAHGELEAFEDYQRYHVDSVWPNADLDIRIVDGQFEAELTVYGSGVPVIAIERGPMVALD